MTWICSKTERRCQSPKIGVRWPNPISSAKNRDLPSACSIRQLSCHHDRFKSRLFRPALAPRVPSKTVIFHGSAMLSRSFSKLPPFFVHRRQLAHPRSAVHGPQPPAFRTKGIATQIQNAHLAARHVGDTFFHP